MTLDRFNTLKTEFLKSHTEWIPDATTKVIDGEEQTIFSRQLALAFIDWLVCEGHADPGKAKRLKAAMAEAAKGEGS